MKKLFLFALTFALIISCSKKDIKFEAFSAEAFAFDIGDGTAEVNATVRVKGFTQTENDNNLDQNIGIFPNPIIEGSSINILNNDNIVLTVEIYNNTGQLLQSHKNIINSLDTSNLGKGYYIFSLRKSNGSLLKNIGFVVL